MHHNVFAEALRQKVILPVKGGDRVKSSTYAKAPIKILIGHYSKALKLDTESNDDSDDDGEQDDEKKDEKKDDEDENEDEDEDETRNKIASWFYEQSLKIEITNSRLLERIEMIKGPLKFDIARKGHKIFIIFDDGKHELRRNQKIKYCGDRENVFTVNQLAVAIADYIKDCKKDACVDIFLEADGEVYTGKNVEGSIIDVGDKLYQYTSKLVREPMKPEPLRANLRIHAISRRELARDYYHRLKNEAGNDFFDGFGKPIPDEYSRTIVKLIYKFRTFPDWIVHGLAIDPRLKKQGPRQLAFQQKIVDQYLVQVEENTTLMLGMIEHFYKSVTDDLRGDDAKTIRSLLADSDSKRGDGDSSSEEGKEGKDDDSDSDDDEKKDTILSSRLVTIIPKIVDNPKVFLEMWPTICSRFALEESTGQRWAVWPIHPCLALSLLYAASASNCHRVRILVAVYTAQNFEYPTTFFMDPYAFNRMTRSYPAKTKKGFCSNSGEVKIGIVYTGTGHSGSYLNWFRESGYEIITDLNFQSKDYREAETSITTPCVSIVDDPCVLTLKDVLYVTGQNRNNGRCIAFNKGRDILVKHIDKYWMIPPNPSYVKVVTRVIGVDEYRPVFHRPSIARIADFDGRSQVWFFDQMVESFIVDGWTVNRDTISMIRPIEKDDDEEEEEEKDEKKEKKDDKYLLIFQNGDSIISWDFASGARVRDLKLNVNKDSGFINIVLTLVESVS